MKTFRLSLTHRGLILVLVPLAFELIFIFLLTHMLTEAEKETRNQITSKQIIKLSVDLSKEFHQTCLTLGLYGLLGNERYHQPFLESLDSLRKKSVFSVKDFGDTTEEQQKVLHDLQSECALGISLLENAGGIVQGGHGSPRYVRSRQLYRDIQTVPPRIEKTTVSLNADPIIPRTSQQIRILVIAGVILNIVVTVILAIFFSKGIAGRLVTIRTNSMRLAMGQPLLPKIKGGDEIAVLDGVFHKMADSLAEASRKERAIIDNAIDVICSLDRDYKFTLVSPGAKAAWGFLPDEIIGKRLSHIVAPDCIEETLESFKAIIESAKPLSLETRIKHKDGTIKHTLWTGAWSQPDRATFCVVHDITENKRIEQLKKEFVAMVSHDLRTPLTSVQCFLEVMGEGVFLNDPEAAMKKSRTSFAEISRLVHMVNSLLDVEKMESGKMDVVFEKTSVAQIIERSVNAVIALAEHKNVQLKSMVATDLIVLADEDLMVQVIVNLLSNAIKFSPSQSEITVAATQNNGTTEISVKDQGRGIPAAFKDKIFDRFQQVELADSRFRGGSGLGLAVCKAIVLAHRGEIGVDSVEGGGSTFWIRLREHAS